MQPTTDGKQHRLCCGILIHSMVKIKMILSKIRKRTDRKINTRNTAGVQANAMTLHDYMRTSGALHFSKKLLKLKSFPALYARCG